MLWLLLACALDDPKPPDLHARCAALVACGSDWARRCTDETGLLAHWDTAGGRVSLAMPAECSER